MSDVLLGESRIYISDKLRRELGWSGAAWVSPQGHEGGLWQIHSTGVWADTTQRLKRRGNDWYFGLKIPGVRRGRLNGARTCKHSVENGTLVLDVRELLAPQDA